jgi:hypothetical protein
MNRINNELLTDVIPRAPNPRYTFYYTMGFGPRNPLILLMKIGAIFIISNESLLTQSIKPALHDLLQNRAWPLQPIDLIAEN